MIHELKFYIYTLAIGFYLTRTLGVNINLKITVCLINSSWTDGFLGQIS